MHSYKKLKICKVESPAFAKYCLMRGADYLGVHCIDFALDESKRQLCHYISTLNGKAVLLTKEESIESLRALADFYKPWALQLHYEISAAEHSRLEQRLGLPIVPVFTDETDDATVKALLEQCQFAIYDTSFMGGTNTSHSKRHLDHLGKLASKVLLAGGISPAAIKKESRPVCGFDVQSFCRVNGRSHYGRAEQLFDLVKGAPERQLSVSLTDVKNLAAVPAYTDSGNLEYQLDYSVGNLYDHFVVRTEHLKRTLALIDAPFTLHIFEAKPAKFKHVIDYFMAVAGHKIVRINLQYSPGLRLDSINTHTAKKCASIYYKDLGAYFNQFPEGHDCVSVILPADLPRKREVLASELALLSRLKNCEVWFDRKIDLATAKLVLATCPNANFIAGEFVIGDWSNETKLLETLQ